ncbi:MAG TPA: PqiC family protein [Rhodocyclaceae bacterium]
MAAAALVGCSGSAPIRYFSLDDGESAPPGSPNGPRVAIVQVNLPELVDRSQLVVRAAGHRLQICDEDRWAEPLRRQIPRLLARDLGVALDSGRVVTLPIDARNFEVDFKVSVDVQRLEAVVGRGVELDAVWRVESRDGRTFFGRTRVWESVLPAADVHASMVASQRLAFLGLARRLAKELVSRSGNPGSLREGANEEGISEGDHPVRSPDRDEERGFVPI